MAKSAGLDVEKGGHLFTANGNANWYSHYSSQFQSSSKS